jgi:hypothetical protein
MVLHWYALAGRQAGIFAHCGDGLGLDLGVELEELLNRQVDDARVGGAMVSESVCMLDSF